MNKKKIINDPVYGFIAIPGELIYDLIQHPYFQRLRYIKQLGLSDLVYPGAHHTRFHHALGAMHLMGRVLKTLQQKGVEISDAEAEAAQIAILLHDIGHGPFSHALEETLLKEVNHESISYLFMRELNTRFNGALDLALQFFRNSYPRKFFHQLVSSQLDIDRLDYLTRDSFFTGVMEGTIGVDRIVAMLNVHNDQLVVEEKGIYSIENFLHARRLMYWQVYLHKTALSAERMLVNIIKRAQYLLQAGEYLPASEALTCLLKKDYRIEDFTNDKELLDLFGQLDDHDIWGAIKLWRNLPDAILSGLCNRLLQRELFQIVISANPIKKSEVVKVRQEISQVFGVLQKDTQYLYSYGTVSNEAYISGGKSINILTRNGDVLDIAHASDLPSIKAISKIVEKNYLCWPKNISL
ncbi:MAG TPA: HD domain-containing protein [Cyclobacteriaceae bacterium]|nr:HD domain-containing protein [Cytophagales bacterium]HMR57837.1 HD domain-containing protein [Cyclobacteriaceae bacterium]HRE66727.1 HD domain-containing protein [Cyclobacteriaceae bacterium]HRF33541.1 HD domain-containing protein [Cyclobacteriaceae bacterium]